MRPTLDLSAQRNIRDSPLAGVGNTRSAARLVSGVMDLAVLALSGSGTALATGIGALPVSRLGAHAATLRPALWGLTVGLMGVASVVGLLLPALDDPEARRRTIAEAEEPADLEDERVARGSRALT